MLEVREDEQSVHIETGHLLARIDKAGYTSGVQGFTDKLTGAEQLGFGLAIADFLLEPVADDPTNPDFDPEMQYTLGGPHGQIVKRYVELPQICTQAGELPCEVSRGEGFVAVQQWFEWTQATYGRRPGSRWDQMLIFPEHTRYFLCSDRITSANDVEALIFRLDMPGHLKHTRGDSFLEVFLSYQGILPAEGFSEDFAPDARFLYRRTPELIPREMIRGYRTRPGGRPGPWLLGMTLDPDIVYEAWCHQRGYVCFIQEIGGLPIQAGESFSAAYVVGWFDGLGEARETCARFSGAVDWRLNEGRWELVYP